MLTTELIAELRASFELVDGAHMSPSDAAARARRLVELIAASPRNRAQFLTLAAVALAGAEACRLR